MAISGEKTLMLGKCEGKRRRGQQRTRWLDSVIEATNMNLTQLWEAGRDMVALWAKPQKPVLQGQKTKQS